MFFIILNTEFIPDVNAGKAYLRLALSRRGQIEGIDYLFIRHEIRELRWRKVLDKSLG